MSTSLDKALQALSRATTLDSQKRVAEAIAAYREGVCLLALAVKDEKDPRKRELFVSKSLEYSARADDLEAATRRPAPSATSKAERPAGTEEENADDLLAKVVGTTATSAGGDKEDEELQARIAKLHGVGPPAPAAAAPEARRIDFEEHRTEEEEVTEILSRAMDEADLDARVPYELDDKEEEKSGKKEEDDREKQRKEAAAAARRRAKETSSKAKKAAKSEKRKKHARRHKSEDSDSGSDGTDGDDDSSPSSSSGEESKKEEEEEKRRRAGGRVEDDLKRREREFIQRMEEEERRKKKEMLEKARRGQL